MINHPVDVVVPENTLKQWQDIVNLLAALCGVPAALVMRLDHADIEVLVSSKSAGNPYHPGEREHFDQSGLYCETAIKSGNKLLIPDALSDEHWKNNPDVKRNMISYLGFPIFLPDQTPFGTVCVLDNKRNEYSQTIVELVRTLKGIIESHLETIYMNHVLGEKNKRLADYLSEIQALRGLVHICSSCKAIQDSKGEWQPIEHYLIKHPVADFSHSICPACMKKLYPDFSDGPS